MNLSIQATWDGNAFVPQNAYRRRCERLILGKIYRLDIDEQRSLKSHNHYFAALHEAWRNLPERMVYDFASPEHLRKFALIKCKYYHHSAFVCATYRDALTVASYIKKKDEFSLTEIKRRVIDVYDAKSQSMEAMGKAEFQKSKTDVLDYCAALIGVSTDDLKRNAVAA